ncbi:hypothetical protein PSPO01_03857 [Paraphaeosphaeria sporulosa]
MPFSKPTVPVHTRVHAPATLPKSCGKSNVKKTSKVNTKDGSTQPRPDRLHIHFHPHPLKSTNVDHINNVNASIVPGALPVDTGLYLRPSRSLFSHGGKAPIMAYIPPGGKPSTHCMWTTDSAHFNEAIDLYMKHGFVKAVIKNTNVDGEKVKCSVLLIGPWEQVPKGAFKIHIWKEPVTWVRAAWMAVKDEFRKSCEEVREQIRKEKEENEMKKRAEEKSKALESESEDGEWDEQIPWE